MQNLENINFLAQYIMAMSDAVSKLELFIKNNDLENVQRTKKIISDLQKEIQKQLREG